MKQEPELWWLFPPEQNNLVNTTNTAINSTSSENATIGSTTENSTQTETQAYKEERFVKIYFNTADEIVYSSDRLVDIANFISSVGGNLGLFLGFSFFGLLFTFYERTENLMKRYWLK